MSSDPVISGSRLSEFTLTERRLGLSFVIGEFRLFVRRFHAVSLRAHFNSYPADPEAEAVRVLQQSSYDAVYLPGCPSPAPRKRLTSVGAFIQYVPDRYPLYYVAISGTFDEYLKRFSSKSRRHQRQAVNKLQEHCGGAMVLREYRRPEEMQSFQHLAYTISETTYQSRLLGVGIPRTPEFLEKLAREASEGNVRSYVLFNGDRPIAFAYCSGQGRNLTYQVIGYDPGYRSLSPGRVLLFLILERLFSEATYDVFDFGAGEAFYKSFFATDSLWCADLYYFRATLGNRLTLWAHILTAALSRSLVRAFASLGIKERLKKWLRKQASGGAKDTM